MSLQDTLAWLRPLARRAGITRVADVTWMDYVGMPCFQAIRPRSRNYVVAQGKGLDAERAEISAMMESLESLHAEQVPVVARASIAEMRSRLGYDPETLTVTSPPLDPHVVHDWAPAVHVGTGEADFVPADLVSLDFTVDDRFALAQFRTTSNGLAAGRTRTQALLHGIYEVIERDSLSRSEPVPLGLDNLPGAVRPFVARLAECAIDVQLAHLPNRFDLPCFKATVLEQQTSLSFWGSACHATREEAVLGALTEAVQSRVVMITGSRDDIEEMGYAHFRNSIELHEPAAHDAAGRSVDAIPELRFATPQDELQGLLGLLAERANAFPLCVDLTRSDIGVPIFFTVIPGLLFTHR